MDVSYIDLVKGLARKERLYRASIEKAGDEFKADFGPCFVVKDIDKAKRRITAVVSTPELDRHEEVVLPEAFKDYMGVYMENPVVITSHQHRLDNGSSSVIGNTVGWKIDSSGLTVTIEFIEGTALGDEYWLLYSKKKQRAFSIGFIPHEHRYEDIEGKSVFVHTLIELIEISCVAVPANRGALSKSRQRKREFVADKRQQREDDKILAQVHRERPDFEQECEAFAEAVLGLSDEIQSGEFEAAVRENNVGTYSKYF